MQWPDAMEKRERTSQESVAALPIELWQCIASYTSLKAWASAAATCKALCSLQLLDMEITGEGGIAGICWMHCA